MAAVCLSVGLLSIRLLLGGEPPPITAVPVNAIRVERIPGGGELLTYFKNIPAHADTQDIPFVSILRDTMGDSDPANDRLREVWAFTYSKPSIVKRIAAGVPFFYHRAGGPRPDSVPRPLLDLAAPAKGTVPRILGDLLQSRVLDALGMPYRAITRAYRSRSGEYRTMNLWRSIDVLSADHGMSTGLSGSELDRVKGRLLLARRSLGGLVSANYVAPAWNRFESAVSQARGHNWELLRQRAEDNHLYFQPLEPSGPGASFAMLWIDQAAVASAVKFDSKFLGISDPFTDPRLLEWHDYSETWWFDADGSRVPPETPGARAARMIPVSLYSLEYPRVPLLLVDFRNPGGPRRREMLRRAADDVTTSVLGWTVFGNWTYLAVKSSWSFVHGRHGAPFDRTARVRAYVQLRQYLLGNRLDSNLSREIARHMHGLDVNPLVAAPNSDIESARRMYAALVHRVETGAITRDLQAGRSREAAPLMHSGAARAAGRTAAIVTFGIYRPRNSITAEQTALVDLSRRIAWHSRYLEDVLLNGGRADVVADLEAVRRSADELAVLSNELPETRGRSTRLIEAIRSKLPVGKGGVEGGQ